MPRLLFDDLYAGQCRLEADKRQELSKRPGMNHVVDLAGHLRAVTDAQQLFKVHDAAVSGCGIDDLPADAVVLAPDPSGLASLPCYA